MNHGSEKSIYHRIKCSCLRIIFNQTHGVLGTELRVVAPFVVILVQDGLCELHQLLLDRQVLALDGQGT